MAAWSKESTVIAIDDSQLQGYIEILQTTERQLSQEVQRLSELKDIMVTAQSLNDQAGPLLKLLPG